MNASLKIQKEEVKMSWILRIISGVCILSALHNWDLWCGNIIEHHFGYAMCFGSAGLIILLFEVKHKNKINMVE